MTRIEFLVACVIFFPFLVMRVSEGRPGGYGLLSGFGDSSLMALEPHECTDMMCDTEVFSSFFPEIKPTLFECLIRKGFHIDIYVHRLESLCNECLGLVLGTFPVPRRHLKDQSQSPPPALSPGPASSPPPSRSSDARGEEQTPSSVTVQTPSSAPSQSPDAASPSLPSPGQYSAVLPGNVSPSVPHNRLPNPTPVLNEQGRTKSVIIAVVLSSVGTSLLFACVFCCYRKFFQESCYSRKEENPLLHLSEFPGPSNKSFGLVSVYHYTEKLGGLPPSNGSYQNDQGFSVDDHLNGTSPSDLMSGYPHTSNGTSLGLPLPPGRLISSAVPTAIPVVSAPAAAVPPSPAASLPLPPIFASPPLLPIVTSSPLPSLVAAPPPPPNAAAPPPFNRPISEASAPPPPQPPLPNQKHYARPPPPPPPKANLPRQLQETSKSKGPSNFGGAGDDGNTSKAKLKPFFWDKVLANPNQSNVWQQIRSGSFQLDEEMIESLFGYTGAAKSNEGKKEASAGDLTVQFIQLLDPKKSQNLAISLKALSVKKQEVLEALMEGDELPTALLQTLLRMQPTTDEELKLRLYNGDLSLLGPAEQFLKDLINVPFAYKRMDVLLFMSSLHEDVSVIKESLATLEASIVALENLLVACIELKSNRLFLKLLEAVLKTGNRMNDGTFRGGAQAFKLDTLLKLSDVKGADGKTTLLHFVVQEIIRSEGKRATRSERSAGESGNKSSLGNLSCNSGDFYEDSALESEDNCFNLGLNIVSSLSGELENVKKAAVLDVDAISSTVTSFGRRLTEIKEFLNRDMKNLEEDSGFHHSLKCFVGHAETAITLLLEEELRIRSLLQSTTIYFHGSSRKYEGLQLFVIVRDFLGILDKVCKEVRESAKKVTKPPKVRDSSSVTSTPNTRQLLFPSIVDRPMDSCSSDEDDP